MSNFPDDLTCGTCRFQVNKQCRLLPPAVVLKIVPKQSKNGLLLASDFSRDQGVEMVPMPASLYPPAPDDMPACFQYAPKGENGEVNHE